MKGPAIFLAQFASDEPPFNDLESIAKWASEHGFVGLQIPSWDARLFDLELASESKIYCDEINEKLIEYNTQVTELSTHLQGQLIAVHPAYDVLFDPFSDKSVHKNPTKRQKWAINQLMMAAKASSNLGLKEHVTFSGSLAWPYIYPWPQRTHGLIDTAFDELAKRWLPILDAFDKEGDNLCFEIHPGEDLHDGITFEMFLDQ